jgi:hypothetical protein
MEVTMDRQPNAFASTFYFFANTQGNAKKIKRARKPHRESPAIQCNLGLTLQRIDKRASANSGFKKLAVQWLQEVQFSNETFVVTDSLRLRNRQLLKPTNR